MNPRRTSSIVLVSFLMTLLLPPSAKTGELPAGVKTLRVNGYDMAYMESGSGRPLVMVHGAMSDYRSWAAQMEPFGRTNRAVAVSLRHYFPERWDGKGGSFSWQQHDRASSWTRGASVHLWKARRPREPQRMSERLGSRQF
jgi:hypothetical protein